MIEGTISNTEYLRMAFKRHFNLAPYDMIYLESVIYTSEFDLWQMMLSMYIIALENGELNEKIDTVLCNIKGLIVTRKLDEEILNWQNVVSCHNSKYKVRVEELREIFISYIRALAYSSDADHQYYDFACKLAKKYYSYGYKSKNRVRKRIKQLFRKEN